MTTPEDKGIVPQRRTVMVNRAEREIRGPYDLTYRIQEQLEPLLDAEASALASNDSAALRAAHEDILNVLFVEPLTHDEFLDLPPLEVPVWIATFLADVAQSSTQMAERVMAVMGGAVATAVTNGDLEIEVPQSRSARPSKRTSKQRTR